MKAATNRRDTLRKRGRPDERKEVREKKEWREGDSCSPPILHLKAFRDKKERDGRQREVVRSAK